MILKRRPRRPLATLLVPWVPYLRRVREESSRPFSVREQREGYTRVSLCARCTDGKRMQESFFVPSRLPIRRHREKFAPRSTLSLQTLQEPMFALNDRLFETVRDKLAINNQIRARVRARETLINGATRRNVSWCMFWFLRLLLHLLRPLHLLFHSLALSLLEFFLVSFLYFSFKRGGCCCYCCCCCCCCTKAVTYLEVAVHALKGFEM